MAGYLAGKVVVVTGGGRGIGRAIALAAARRGRQRRGRRLRRRGRSQRRAASSEAGRRGGRPRSPPRAGEAVAAAEDVSTMEGGRARRPGRRSTRSAGSTAWCAARASPSTKYLWEMEEQRVGRRDRRPPQGPLQLRAGRRAGDDAAAVRAASSSSASGAFTARPTCRAYATAKAGVLGLHVEHRQRARAVTASPRTASSRARRPGCPTASTATRRCSATSSVRRCAAISPPARTATRPTSRRPWSTSWATTPGRSTARCSAPRGTRSPTSDEIGWSKVMKNEGPWDVATIVERLPGELGPTLTPRPVPWPERPR